MLSITQKFVILFFFTYFKFILTDVFAEHVAEEENQSLSDSVLTASIDDINDNEVFRRFNTKPFFYPYLHQGHEHHDHPPNQRSSADDNLPSYQQAPTSLFNSDLDEYFLFTPDNNRATVESVEPDTLRGQKFETIVEFLLEKLAHEDEQIIDNLYNLLFDSAENTRPLQDTIVEAHQKCQHCKKYFKQQS